MPGIVLVARQINEQVLGKAQVEREILPSNCDAKKIILSGIRYKR